MVSTRRKFLIEARRTNKREIIKNTIKIKRERERDKFEKVIH